MSLLNEEKASASVRAKTFCDTQLLSKADFKSLIDTQVKDGKILKEYLQQLATTRGCSDYTQALEKYDDLKPPVSITMVKISALQACSKLMNETLTSFDVLRDHYETYREPEGVVIGLPLAEAEVPPGLKKDMPVHHADKGMGRIAIIDAARIVVMFEEADTDGTRKHE